MPSKIFTIRMDTQDRRQLDELAQRLARPRGEIIKALVANQYRLICPKIEQAFNGR
jgi:predicted transcriptional regulator